MSRSQDFYLLKAAHYIFFKLFFGRVAYAEGKCLHFFMPGIRRSKGATAYNKSINMDWGDARTDGDGQGEKFERIQKVQ